MMDLTGMAPTTIYMLGGEPVGFTWFNGGHLGSQNAKLLALSTVPGTELRRSWILTAPAEHARLPTDILNDPGLEFPDDYEEVAHAQASHLNEE
jgi:hypothetical protein